MVCTEDDEYVRDRLRWVVELADGTVVYEDDGRPGAEPPQAWLRLGTHCRACRVPIRRMWIQHRTNRVDVGLPDAPGYYLIKQAFAISDVGSFEAYIAGTLVEGDVVHVMRWQVPELIKLDEEYRFVGADDPSLIAIMT